MIIYIIVNIIFCLLKYMGGILQGGIHHLWIFGTPTVLLSSYAILLPYIVQKIEFWQGAFFRGAIFLEGSFSGWRFFYGDFFLVFFSWWLFFGEHIFGHQKQCTHVINKNKQEGTISSAKPFEKAKNTSNSVILIDELSSRTVF